MHDTIPLLHIDLHYKQQSCSILEEPTSAPRELKILRVMDTYAELSWKTIPCCDQHGIIGHYWILYDHILPNGTMVEEESKTLGNFLEITLLNLRPNTEYFVRVAGVNGAGPGASSLPLALITTGGKKMGLFKQSPRCFINAVLFRIARPGKVYISSVNSTCHSVTIDWVLPLDENDIPYDVKLKYSYTTKRLPETFYENVSGALARCVVENLPSDTSVKFSFRAITKKERKGPPTYYTVKTKKPSESMLCYAARVHYICVRIRMYNFI